MVKFIYVTPHVSSYTVARISSIYDFCKERSIKFVLVETNSRSYFYSHHNIERERLMNDLNSTVCVTKNLGLDQCSFVNQIKKIFYLIKLTRSSEFSFFIGYNSFPSLLACIGTHLPKSKTVARILGIDSRLHDVNSKIFLISQLKTLALRLFDYACVASLESSIYLESLKFDRKNTFLPYYFSPPFNSKITELSNRKDEILIVARLVPRKNLETAIQAFAKYVYYSKKFSRPIPLLRIIGNGPEETNLKCLVSSLEIDKYVCFMLDQPNSTVLECLRMSRLSILPSYTDQFGIFVLESLSVNTPILVSLFVGASEAIVEGINGFLFDPYSVDSLFEKICLYFDSFSQIDQNVLTRVNKAVLDKYSPNAFLSSLETIYKSSSFA